MENSREQIESHLPKGGGGGKRDSWGAGEMLVDVVVMQPEVQKGFGCRQGVKREWG